jgi:hypothetical protein
LNFLKIYFNNDLTQRVGELGKEKKIKGWRKERVWKGK